MKPFIRMMALAAVVWLTGGVASAGPEHEHASSQAAGLARVTGTLHAVDVQKRTVNIDHPAVPEFKWPAMRMDFAVARGADLAVLKPVQPVRFTIARSDQGSFTITEIEPAR
ncbi:MAG: copper-binding protein [Magnetococcus sp. DMHC-8]